MSKLDIGRLKQQAIEEVKKYHPKAQDVSVTRTRPNFVGGTLITVDYLEQKKSLMNYVWIRGEQIEVIFNDESLIEEIMIASSARRDWSWLFGVETVSAIIALVLTVTIVYQSTNGEPNQILSASLTLILGYYFGQHSTKQSAEGDGAKT